MVFTAFLIDITCPNEWFTCNGVDQFVFWNTDFEIGGVGTLETIHAGYHGDRIVARRRIGVCRFELVGRMPVAEIPMGISAMIPRSVGMDAVVGDETFVDKNDVVHAVGL